MPQPLMRLLRPAAGVYVSVATAAPLAAQTQSAQFDGGVETSHGLRWTFSRPTAVFDARGQIVAPDTPRFQPETLFCALPDLEVLEVGKSINAIAAGGDASGQVPAYLILTTTLQRLSVHTGEGSVEHAFLDGDWAGAYVLTYRDPGKDNNPNLLVGQSGRNGGSADSPDKAFALTSGATIHNGLIVVGCEVREPDAGGWISRRAALAYTTLDRLSREDPWIVCAVGAPTNELDTERGSPWSLSAFPIGNDELVVTWTDYRTPAKTGGAAYATRLARSGGQWSAGPTIRLAASDTPVFTEHWHAVGFLRHVDGRESMLISTGDGIEDNRLIAQTRAAGGDWASPEPIPDTGIDALSRVYPASPDWTESEDVWGGQGLDFPRRHNQAISMLAADGSGARLLCGTDETGSVVLALTYDPDTRSPRWETAYLPAITSWPGDGVLNFAMRGAPGGPYFGRIDAASTQPWQANQRETRIIFSPDGIHWGQCLVAGTAGSRPAVFAGNRAYVGSRANEEVGFRSLALPEHRIVRPLALSPSRDNLLQDRMSLPTEGLDDGVTVTRLEGVPDLPAGVPAPPCEPRHMFLIDNASENGNLGIWHPGSSLPDVPAPRASVLLRAWLYALSPDEASDPHTTAQVVARMYDADGDHMNLKSDRLQFDSGAWTPLTVWARFRPLDSIGTRPQLYWLPAVALTAERNVPTSAPCRFIIVWELLAIDAPTAEGHGLPSGAAGSTEEALLEGFELGGDWTLLAVGMLPEDQWDNRVGGSSGTGPRTTSTHVPTLLTLGDTGSLKDLAVLADPALEGIRLRLDDGSESRKASHVRTMYWLRGSPVQLVMRARGDTLTLDYSVGGSPPQRLTVEGALSPDSVRLGPDAMWWHAIEAIPAALRDEKLEVVFESMSLRCPADFNRDNVIDSRDVLAFLNAWNARLPESDFDHNGVIDTGDILAYLNAYAGGC